MSAPLNPLLSMELRINAQNHADVASDLLRNLLHDGKLKMSDEVRDELAKLQDDLHRVCVYLKILNMPTQVAEEITNVHGS